MTTFDPSQTFITQEALKSLYERSQSLQGDQRALADEIKAVEESDLQRICEKLEHEKVSTEELHAALTRAQKEIEQAQKTGKITVAVSTSALLITAVLVSIAVNRGEAFKEIASNTFEAFSEMDVASFGERFSSLADSEFFHYYQSAQFQNLGISEARGKNWWHDVKKFLRGLGFGAHQAPDFPLTHNV